MPYTIRHIRLNESSPFRTLSKRANSTQNISKLSSINNDILLDKIKAILGFFIYYFIKINQIAIEHNCSHCGFKPTELIEKNYFHTIANAFIFDTSDIISNKYSDSLGMSDEFGIPSDLKIEIQNNSININIPIENTKTRIFTIINKQYGRISYYDYYVTQLKNLLQGVYDKKFFINNILSEEYVNNLDDIIHSLHLNEYDINISYTLKKCDINLKAPELQLIGVQSYEEIEQSLMNMFTNPEEVVRHSFQTVNMANSFYNSTDYSEIINFVNKYTCVVKSYYYSKSNTYSDFVSKQLLKELSSSNLKNFDFKDTSKIYKNGTSYFSISTDDPNKQGFSNSILLDEKILYNKLSKNHFYFGKSKKITKFNSLINNVKEINGINCLNNTLLIKNILDDKINDEFINKLYDNTMNDKYNRYINSLVLSKFGKGRGESLANIYFDIYKQE